MIFDCREAISGPSAGASPRRGWGPDLRSGFGPVVWHQQSRGQPPHLPFGTKTLHDLRPDRLERFCCTLKNVLEQGYSGKLTP